LGQPKTSGEKKGFSFFLGSESKERGVFECSLLGGGLSGRLGWLSGNGVALLQELESLGGLGLQVGHVGHQLNRVDHLLVVEQHASDLRGHIAESLLNKRVNRISNLLSALVGVQSLKGLHVNQLSLLLLLGGSLSLHLLLHLSGLLLLLEQKLGLLLLLHGDLLLLLGSEGCRGHRRHIGGVNHRHGLFSCGLLRGGSLLARHVLPAVLRILIVAVVGASALVIAVLVLRAVASSSLAQILGVSGLRLEVHSLGEVGLEGLEGALFALLVQVGDGHPELDGEGSTAENAGLVKNLDGLLGALNVLVQDEVLSVGSLLVEVLALTQFN